MVYPRLTLRNFQFRRATLQGCLARLKPRPIYDLRNYRVREQQPGVFLFKVSIEKTGKRGKRCLRMLSLPGKFLKRVLPY